MHYGDEQFVTVGPAFDPGDLSRARAGELFHKARRVTAFESTPNQNFIHDPTTVDAWGLWCYRIDGDRLIEINDTYLKTPIVIRNTVSDLISFQFVSTVKRSEFLGTRKNVHDLGPALLVSAVPGTETTYRVPKANVQLRHVAIHTTLSNLMERMGEPIAAYPDWLASTLDGRRGKPHQRVFFLEATHRDPIWSCFHLPVSGTLLGQWMSAKFEELLCIGLQILKNSRDMTDSDPVDLNQPCGEKIRRARTILGMEYANPPPIPVLARQLGISETRLKSGFKSMTGMTVMQYCLQKRVEAARFLLKESRHSISEIGNIVGYEDHSAFSRAFRRYCGYSPREWQRSHTIESG